MRMKKLLGCFLILLLFMGCAGDTTERVIYTDTDPIANEIDVDYPQWIVDAPESHGMSTELLNDAAEAVRKIGGRQGFVFIRDGMIIHETYYYGNRYTKNTAFSATKSFGATLVGIAYTMGLLDLDDPVSKWIDKPKASINKNATIRHLLTQTSQAEPPGSFFIYDSFAVVDTLSAIVSEASLMKSKDFAKKYLMGPLGITDYTWLADLQGNVHFGIGLSSSCLDLAKLGQLYLNGGVWRGTRILSQKFIDEAVKPQFPDANAGYGFLWWLNQDDGTWHSPLGSLAKTGTEDHFPETWGLGKSGTGKMIAGAPANSYRAVGLLGQLIFVVPDLNIVAVTMGTTLNIEDWYTYNEFWEAIEPCMPAD